MSSQFHCRCAQLSTTTQHAAVRIIFPLYLDTTTVAQMLSIKGEEEITLSLLTGKFMLVAMDTYTIRYEMLF